jgi:hypothetical protein
MNHEFEWRKQLRKLGGEVEPSRDLWPDIDARIGAAGRTPARPVRAHRGAWLALAAQVHQRGVDAQSIQPRGKRALVAKARQLLPGAHERILGQFLGAAAIHADQAQDRAVHAPHMAAIQLLEGRRVAVERAPHQAGVVRQDRQLIGWNVHAERGTLHAAFDAANGGLV